MNAHPHRLVGIGDDLAFETLGADGFQSRLVYLTGNAQDRLAVGGEHRHDDVADGIGDVLGAFCKGTETRWRRLHRHVRYSRPIPGSKVSQDTRIITPVMPGEEPVLVIKGDGSPVIWILATRSIGPLPVWGCAICEQFHPHEVKGCPLARGAVREIPYGPIYVNDEPVYFAAKVSESCRS